MLTKEYVFKNFLKDRGLRFTAERKAILEAITLIDGHYDVESLFAWLKNKNKQISIATIYRAVPLFVESGIIKEAITKDDRSHYESLYGKEHHDHLICIKCGTIIEFKDESIERLQNLVCKQFNFKPLEHKLSIRGYCAKCQIK
jgi:Fur family ferric uptake transcriptional regulator